jgi:hypothetical protein
MINADQLKENDKLRKKFKLEPYRLILDMICNKIKESSIILGNQYCVYQVPELIFGYSTYDINDCCTWLIKKLKNRGFTDVTLLEKNILIIIWNH